MGKHLDRALGLKKTVTETAKYELEKDEAYKDLVQRVDNIEITIKEIVDNLLGLKEEDKPEEDKPEEDKQETKDKSKNKNNK